MLKSQAAPTGLAPLLAGPVPSSFLPSLAASRHSCCPSLLACQGIQGCSQPASTRGSAHRAGTLGELLPPASRSPRRDACDRPVGQAGWHRLSFASAVNPLVLPVGAPLALPKDRKPSAAPRLDEAEIPGNANLIWPAGSSPRLQLAVGARVGSQPSAAKVTH